MNGQALLFPADTLVPLPVGFYERHADGYVVDVDKMDREQQRLWQLAMSALCRPSKR